MNIQRKKILHISHSLDTGGGPLYIKKIIEDIPEFAHFVAGNEGYFFGVIAEIISQAQITKLRGKNILANFFIIWKIIHKENISVIHCHGRGAGIYGRL